MIPELVSYITRSEGRKFLRLQPSIDESALYPEKLVTGGGVSLYVHIPFCRRLCPFCCFNRYLFQEDTARRYFTDLKKELEMYRKRGFKFSGVYFGGGTPTVLMDELGGFIRFLRESFTVKEISLETTPRELTPQNVDMLKQYGVNRLSIGVQSFDEQVLKSMGRDNGPPEEVRANLLAVAGKFETVNVDFVFNFPGQTVGQFAADVAAFKEMQIDQATFYPLMASPHKKDAMERRFNKVDNSREKQFYDVIMKQLYHSDYSVSTAWCFSRGKRMIDEYIIESDDYIGIGAGSVSMAGGNFYVNSFAPDRYHEMIAGGRFPIVGWRKLTEKENRRYYLLTKLFGMKVDTAEFRRRFGGNMARKLWLETAFFKASGVVSGKDILLVTEKGMYPVSVMMRDFFASLNTLREQLIERKV
jgi:coproporphyrinogen III oxidase-like Fe-S oxidoreductase